MFSRRSTLAWLSATATSALAPHALRAAPASTLRLGFQKGEPILVAARQNHSLEQALAPLGIKLEWTEFAFGPPMLEAMRVGSIDFGGVGDTPPIFAQAAHADLLYVAGVPAGASALLLPSGSKLKTLADLKGRRLAFARGSSAHNLAVAAVEKGGLLWSDVIPVSLTPADAAAAFGRGEIDAWSIWDPYYALYEKRPGVRVLATSKEIVAQNSFFIAGHAYTAANPKIIATTVTTVAKVATWASEHREKVADLLAAGTGVPADVELRAIERNPLKVLPMNETFAASQQHIADRFHALGLIPTRITVASQVWHASV